MIHNLVDDKGALKNTLPKLHAIFSRRISDALDDFMIDDMDYPDFKVGICLPITILLGDKREIFDLTRRMRR